MKRFACMMTAVFCVLGSASGESRVGPFASWVTSDDENAVGAGVKYEWLFNENFGVDVRASYLTSDDLYIIPLEAGLLGILPLDKVSLYAGAGAGYYIPEDTGLNMPWGKVEGPDPAFGFYVLAGIRLPVGDRMELFAEGKYTQAESDEETGGGYWRNGSTYVVSETTKMGMEIDGMGANLGLLWKF